GAGRAVEPTDRLRAGTHETGRVRAGFPALSRRDHRSRRAVDRSRRITRKLGPRGVPPRPPARQTSSSVADRHRHHYRSGPLHPTATPRLTSFANGTALVRFSDLVYYRH